MSLQPRPDGTRALPRPEPTAVADAPVSVRQTDQLDLAAVATAASCARVFARITLTGWGATDVLDDVELVVSELVTNAVKMTGIAEPKPNWSQLQSVNLLTVCLTELEAAILIEVWDTSPEEPVVKQATPGHDGERGVALVKRLARRWGSYAHSGGKVVWAELPADRRDLSEMPKVVQSTTSLAPSRAADWLVPDPQVLKQVIDGLQEL